MASRAISQADLATVPMQATALDAQVGSEALGRKAPHAAVFTKTGAAIKTRARCELEAQLRAEGIDLIETPPASRAAFAELFAHGGDLGAMMENPDITTGGRGGQGRRERPGICGGCA